MKKVKDILNKIEVIFYFIFASFTVPLHSSIPYNFWLFLFDFSFVLFMIIEWFSFEIFKNDCEKAHEKCETFFMRIWGILGIIILAKYTDFFESIFSKVFG